MNVVELSYDGDLEIGYLSRLFDNTSECYKFFWFQAIMTKVIDGKDTFSYEELVDEMITDAWYMVSEYHLNLGPNDTLEKTVDYLKQTTSIKSSEKKEALLEYIKNTADSELIRKKKTLINDVPYRIQAPFINIKTVEWNKGKKALIETINKKERLMYKYSEYNGLETEIRMSRDWFDYLSSNREIIFGWLKFNMINYLQRRNPTVPGISDKLEPPQERKLESVKKFWLTIVDICPLHEIYNSQKITEKNISVDHFVPWSYIANDEFWNLHPTTRHINSSKNNNLPDWNTYFPLLCKQEYKAYKLIWENNSVHTAFEKCRKTHMNSEEVKKNLYRKGLSEREYFERLEAIMAPVYQAARNCGFKKWSY